MKQVVTEPIEGVTVASNPDQTNKFIINELDSLILVVLEKWEQEVGCKFVSFGVVGVA